MSEDISKGDRLRLAIGGVVINFQFIENELAEIICGLLQLKEELDVQRISSAMSFKQKVDLMCEVYPMRRKNNWPVLDIKSVRSSLNAIEEFRNAIVHSFWYVNSNKQRLIWMRSKGSLRSSSGLAYVNGVADVSAMETGIVAMETIRDWYLGETAELMAATAKIKVQTKRLTRRVHIT